MTNTDNNLKITYRLVPDPTVSVELVYDEALESASFLVTGVPEADVDAVLALAVESEGADFVHAGQEWLSEIS